MMLKNYYKVVEDFDSRTHGERAAKNTVDRDAEKGTINEYLSVEKGEIIVDVEDSGCDWVIGRALVTQKMGKIPRKCIELLRDDEDAVESDAKKADVKRCSRLSIGKRRSSAELDGRVVVKEGYVEVERHSPGGKRCSSEVDRKSAAKEEYIQFQSGSDDKRSSSELREKTEIKEEYVECGGKGKAPQPPVAPPRLRKSRDVSREIIKPNGEGDSFRSRGSDEGYNSSSHYSGDKPSTSDVAVSPSAYRISDVPMLSSFGESPNRLVSPRPSITDAEGYEVPMFSGRSSVNGEIATGDEKGITLKFIFNRKSTAFDEKLPDKDPNGKVLLNSIGEKPESIYETWSIDPDNSRPSESFKSETREKFRVSLITTMSLLVALGVFFVLLFVTGVNPLLCFTISVNIFAIFFIGILTMENKRWLCIAALLAPSLFSRKFKVAISITLLVLIVALPVCNFTSNIDVVMRCKQNAAGKSAISERSVTAGTSFTSNTSKNAFMEASKQVVEASKPSVNLKNISSTNSTSNNSEVLMKCRKDIGGIKSRCPLPHNALRTSCLKALKNVVENNLHAKCNAGDKYCMAIMLEPRIHNICRNLNLGDLVGKNKRLNDMQRVKIQEKESFASFSHTLLQLLPLLLLLLLAEAYQYNRDYLSNKEMDNVYITGKLKAYDCDRKERGMRNKLFPLRKLEFRKYVLPSFFLQTSKETKEVFAWLLVWLILGLGVLLAILLDKYIYETFMFLYEDTKSYNSCDLAFKIIQNNVIYSLCFLLALFLIAVIIQSYILRSRSRICSYFYPQKESARGVYLYHKILRDRGHFWKACRERGSMLSEARRTRWKIGIGHRLFRVLPISVQNGMEKMFVYRCMICDSLTYRNSFVCRNEDCFATFCYGCYIDMGQTCISCSPNGMRDSVFTPI